jgi:uncharacterized protein (TIGR02246 family)
LRSVICEASGESLVTGSFKAALAAMLVLGSAACAHRPPADDSETILALQTAVDDALIANDAEALAQLLTDDLSRIGPGGVMTNRDQWLAQIRTADIRYLSVVRCETSIRFHANAAIVTGLVDIEVEKPGTGREMEHNRYTRTYIRQANNWRLAAHQATRAPAGASC